MIRTYASNCIVGYIVGVGDRHLDNFLVNTRDGSVVMIDFGYSFGSGR